MSTLNLENIKHPDSASNNISVDSSGRTGVGTATPSATLHVEGGSNTQMRVSSTGAEANLTLNGGSYAQINNTTGTLYVTNDTASDIEMRTASTTRLKVDASGRVTMPYQPMFSGYNADGTQTLTRNIHWTAYTNVGNHMATSTGVFTCPVAGKYFCSFSSLSQASSGQEIAVLQNGAFNLRMWDDGTDWEQHAGAGILDCSANDTLEFYSNGRLVHGGAYTFASIHLIG